MKTLKCPKKYPDLNLSREQVITNTREQIIKNYYHGQLKQNCEIFIFAEEHLIGTTSSFSICGEMIKKAKKNFPKKKVSIVKPAYNQYNKE